MSGKQKWAAGSVLFVLFVAICAAGGAYWAKRSSEQQASQQPERTLSSAASNGRISLSMQSQPTQVQGQSTIAAGSASQDFSKYEQYKDKTEAYFADVVTGQGAEAAKDKTLAVAYKGYLTNGKLFDQSPQLPSGKPQPYVFVLGSAQTIAGFQQGVAGMKVGGKRLVIVPPAMGYGAEGNDAVPPNSVLVFEVELLTVQ